MLVTSVSGTEHTPAIAGSTELWVEMRKIGSLLLTGPRWRTHSELNVAETFTHDHWAATVGATPGRACGWLWRFLGHIRWRQQPTAQRQQSPASPVCKQPEVSNPHEAGRQDMEQEAAEEFVDVEPHQPLLVLVGGVAPAEGDATIGKGHQTVVGDGDPVGVAAEVLQGVLGAAEGPFGVNHPSLGEQRTYQGIENPRYLETSQRAVKLEPMADVQLIQTLGKLGAEYLAERFHGQKEAGRTGDPACVVRAQAAGWHDAVDVRMMLQLLTPGMEHAEEADLGAQMLGVASHFQ